MILKALSILLLGQKKLLIDPFKSSTKISAFLGLKSYGKTLQMLPSHLGSTSVPDILAIMAVLVLLAYFEVGP